MNAIVLFAGMLAVVSGGVIHHEDEHGGHATSYQHVKIENYHAVPVFVKKEHSELVEHPVSAGHVSHGVEVHHGDGHHDPGYAIASGHHQEPHHEVAHLLVGHQEEASHGEGLGAYARQDISGHEEVAQQGYEGHGYAALESHDGYDGNVVQGHGSYEALGHGGHY